MTWKSILNLIFIPFESCFQLLGQPLLEGVSVLEILIAFIIIMILIKTVIPIAHISLDGGFDTYDAHEQSKERAAINESKRQQRIADYESRRQQRINDQKDMTKWRYKYNHDSKFRKEQGG